MQYLSKSSTVCPPKHTHTHTAHPTESLAPEAPRTHPSGQAFLARITPEATFAPEHPPTHGSSHSRLPSKPRLDSFRGPTHTAPKEPLGHKPTFLWILLVDFIQEAHLAPEALRVGQHHSGGLLHRLLLLSGWPSCLSSLRGHLAVKARFALHAARRHRALSPTALEAHPCTLPTEYPHPSEATCNREDTSETHASSAECITPWPLRSTISTPSGTLRATTPRIDYRATGGQPQRFRPSFVRPRTLHTASTPPKLQPQDPSCHFVPSSRGAPPHLHQTQSTPWHATKPPLSHRARSTLRAASEARLGPLAPERGRHPARLPKHCSLHLATARDRCVPWPFHLVH